MNRTDRSAEKMSARQRLNLNRTMIRIVELLSRHHPDNLTFSKVSRFCKVPRATLYYYFGNSLDSMLVESVRFGMKMVLQLDGILKEDLRHPDWYSFQKVRLQKAITMMLRHPWGIVVYFKYRSDSTEIGRAILELENEYCDKLGKAWTHYTDLKPDMLRLRMAGYLKLGMLYGIAAENHLWKKRAKNRELLEVMVERMIQAVSKAVVLEHKFP